MARSKSVTQEGLERLGAPSLAKLLLEHAGSDPVLRKKLRMLMAGPEGAGKFGAVLVKRIRTIGRSRSFVNWEKRKGLVQELDFLRTTITDTQAAQDPKAAAELMWELIGAADSVVKRVGDGVPRERNGPTISAPRFDARISPRSRANVQEYGFLRPNERVKSTA